MEDLFSLPVTLVVLSLALAGELRGLIASVSDPSIITRPTRQSRLRALCQQVASRHPGNRKGAGPGVGGWLQWNCPCPSPSRLQESEDTFLYPRNREDVLTLRHSCCQTEQPLETT